MRFDINYEGLEEAKRLLSQWRESSLNNLRKFLLHILVNQFLSVVKSNLSILPSGPIESTYKDNLYVADVTGLQNGGIAAIVGVRSKANKIPIETSRASDAESYLYPHKAVVSFPFAKKGSSSWFAAQIADYWTFDTLPRVLERYEGSTVLRIVNSDELQVINADRKALDANGKSDVDKLTANLEKAGFTLLETSSELYISSEFLVDLPYYVLRIEKGSAMGGLGVRAPHWRPAVTKLIAIPHGEQSLPKRAGIMREWKRRKQDAMRILSGELGSFEPAPTDKVFPEILPEIKKFSDKVIGNG